MSEQERDTQAEGLQICFARLTSSEQKTVRKIENALDLNGPLTLGQLRDFVNIDPRSLKSIGRRTTTIAKSVLVRIDLDPTLYLVTPSDPKVPLYALEETLIEDINLMLANFADLHQETFLKRSGLGEPKQTLEEIAKSQTPSVTRERIRQIEKEVIEVLARSISFDGTYFIEQVLRKLKNGEGISTILPSFVRPFESSVDAIPLLEAIFRLKEGHLEVHSLVPKELSTKDFLGDFFAWHSLPMPIEMFTAEVVAETGVSPGGVRRFLLNCEKVGHVVSKGEDIIGIQVDRASAVACEMIHHPGGLPWKQIIRNVNSKCLSKKKLNESRRSPEIYITENNDLFLSDWGVYKHRIYWSVNEATESAWISEIRQILSVSSKASSLSGVKRQLDSRGLPKVEYFELRDIVWRAEGITLNGKSRVDTISLGSVKVSLSLRTQIIAVLEGSKRALSKSEISEMVLKTSAASVAFQLSLLVNSGEVVRVNVGGYLLREQVRNLVSCDELMARIQALLVGEERIVTADFMRLRINEQLGTSYTREVYRFLARELASEATKGVFASGGLFANQPIPYRSKTELFSVCADRASSNEQFFLELERLVTVTESLKAQAYNWICGQEKSTIATMGRATSG